MSQTPEMPAEDLTPPISQPRRVAELATRKANRFRLLPDAEACSALADWAGVDKIADLKFEGELNARGKSDWELTGTLTAAITQPCAVTAEPVVTRISESLRRYYVADLPEPTAEEMEMPEDDSVEALPAVIDLGHVLCEAVELAIPLFPRAEGVELGAFEARPKGAEPIDDEKIKPFAGLADLLKKSQKDE